MRSGKPVRWVCRVLLVTCPVLLTPGCSKWTAADKPVSELLDEESPRDLRLHLQNVPPIEVQADAVELGVVYGQGLNWLDAPITTWSRYRVQPQSGYVAIPLSDVSAVDVEYDDTVGTILVVTLVAAAIAAVVAVIAMDDMWENCSPPSGSFGDGNYIPLP